MERDIEWVVTLYEVTRRNESFFSADSFTSPVFKKDFVSLLIKEQVRIENMIDLNKREWKYSVQQVNNFMPPFIYM